MIIGILSDIHGNIEALEASLKYLENRADSLISLGDVAGYGPDPAECVEIMQEKAGLLLRGNHEESLINNDFTRLKPTAREALEWTKEKLPLSFLEIFKKWPESSVEHGVFLAHASVSEPLYRYIFNTRTASEEFALMKKQICFVGHTHFPGGFLQHESTGKIEPIRTDFSGCLRMKAEEGIRYIVNAGSVGQPRDGFPFACVALYDTDKKLIEINRIEYPAERTRRKIIERGLPSVLAKRVMQAI